MLALLLALTLNAHAHESYPMRPVTATVRVEPSQIVADIKVDSIYWILEVARLYPLPTTNWPPDVRARVESYALAHFKLSSGGAPLTGRMTHARYRQLPWELYEGGTLFLRLVFEPAKTQDLTVTANFYDDYRREMAAESGGTPPYAEAYRTLLTVPGKVAQKHTLTPDSPAVRMSMDEVLRTQPAMFIENVQRGAAVIFDSVSGFIALAAAALCIGIKTPTRRLIALFLVVFGLGATIGSRHECLSWAPWAAALAAALAATLPRTIALPTAAATLCVLAGYWADAAKPQLAHGSAAAVAAALGMIGAGTAVLALLCAWQRANYKHLVSHSSARAEQLLTRRTRLAATLIFILSSQGLWSSFSR